MLKTINHSIVWNRNGSCSSRMFWMISIKKHFPELGPKLSGWVYGTVKWDEVRHFVYDFLNWQQFIHSTTEADKNATIRWTIHHSCGWEANILFLQTIRNVTYKTLTCEKMLKIIYQKLQSLQEIAVSPGLLTAIAYQSLVSLEPLHIQRLSFKLYFRIIFFTFPFLNLP